MKIENRGLVRKTLMVAVGVFLALPMVAIAQQRDGGWNTVDRLPRREDVRRRPMIDVTIDRMTGVTAAVVTGTGTTTTVVLSNFGRQP